MFKWPKRGIKCQKCERKFFDDFSMQVITSTGKCSECYTFSSLDTNENSGTITKYNLYDIFKLFIIFLAIVGTGKIVIIFWGYSAPIFPPYMRIPAFFTAISLWSLSWAFIANSALNIIFPKILREKTQCPHCKKVLFEFCDKRLVAITGNCPYCGSNVLEQKAFWGMSLDKMHETKELTTSFVARKKHFIEKIHYLENKKKLIYILFVSCFVVFLFILSIVGNLVFHLGITAINTYNILFACSWFLLGLLLWPIVKPKFPCPHCNKEISDPLSSKIVFATGNCGHCGLPVFSSNNDNPNVLRS
jgi:hypothetical protein